MNLNNKNIKNDPHKKDIELILKLFNSKKFTKAKQEIDRQIIHYQNSSILYNISGAIFNPGKRSRIIFQDISWPSFKFFQTFDLLTF